MITKMHLLPFNSWHLARFYLAPLVTGLTPNLANHGEPTPAAVDLPRGIKGARAAFPANRRSARSSRHPPSLRMTGEDAVRVKFIE